eukprot:8894190-Pyramimonas_sp.AAC.1
MSPMSELDKPRSPSEPRESHEPINPHEICEPLVRVRDAYAHGPYEPCWLALQGPGALPVKGVAHVDPRAP